ncbi:hypothetical protein AAG906_028035 [Vitis piasezkii]
MVRTEEPYRPSASYEARLSALCSSGSISASQALTVPSPESGVPSSPPQRRYSTRRPPIFPPLEPSVRRGPPKRARTSSPGETSNLQALPEVIIKRPMVTAPPIPGNLDCRAKPFHSELYFEIEAMRQSQTFGIRWDCSRGTISSV